MIKKVMAAIGGLVKKTETIPAKVYQTPLPMQLPITGASGYIGDMSGIFIHQETDDLKWHKSDIGQWYLMSKTEAIKASDVSDYIV